MKLNLFINKVTPRKSTKEKSFSLWPTSVRMSTNKDANSKMRDSSFNGEVDEREI